MGDLLAGEIIKALDTPPTVGDRDDSTLSVTSSTYGAGATVCGVAFTASTTGRAQVFWQAYLDNTAVGGLTFASYRIGTGSVIGAGTEVIAAADPRSIFIIGVNQERRGASDLVTGLTPGATYNVQLMHRRDNNDGQIAWRQITVSPAT